MSDAKHTPGPWLLGATIVDGMSDMEIEIKSDDHHVIAFAGDWDVGQQQTEANARLIAAAPELLEAAKDLLPLAEAYSGEVGIVRLAAKRLRAALAAAYWGC